MIVDQLPNWSKYFSSPKWKTVFDALLSFHDETPEGERRIDGDDIILKVFSYNTLDPNDESARPESHRKYLDIHTSIRRSECIEWYPAGALTVAKPYEAAGDEIVYVRPKIAPVRMMMTPGLFAFFGPEDAHRPQLHPDGGPAQVKKAVVKIHINLVF